MNRSYSSNDRCAQESSCSCNAFAVCLLTLFNRACWAPCIVLKLKRDSDMQIMYTVYRNEGCYSKHIACSYQRPVGLVLRREIIAVYCEIHIQHVYTVRLLILMKGGGTVEPLLCEGSPTNPSYAGILKFKSWLGDGLFKTEMFCERGRVGGVVQSPR